jgi:hypothetical protein
MRVAEEVRGSKTVAMERFAWLEVARRRRQSYGGGGDKGKEKYDDDGARYI